MNIEQWLAVAASLLIVSILASKTSGRTGVPALLLFLFIGMLAGSEGLGGIYFDNYKVAQSVGIVALIYILFSGGLDANLSAIRSVALGGALLSTVGVVVTAGAVGAFSHFILGFTWLEALLLGSIVSSTDAAAVFTVLRSKGLGLKNRLKPLLELESGSNDPLAVLLTVTLIAISVDTSGSSTQIALDFLQQILVGLSVGFGAGKLTVWAINRMNLEFEGLYPVFTVSVVALVFGLSQLAGGNGFLAVYILGLVLSYSRFVHKRSLLIFHDGIAWLSQIVMFLCLGLLVFPSQLPPLASEGFMLAIFLIFVARPIGVFASLIRQGYSFNEKLFVSWVGLRGSVPIILATYPLVAGLSEANKIFNLVFFVVVVSVALQGTTLHKMAKVFKVEAKERIRPRYPIEFIPDTTSKNDLVEIEVPEASPKLGKSILELNLPKNVLIVLMQRDGETLVPNGSTILQGGDSLLVLADAEQAQQVKNLILIG
jgi:cell volume regulation protein A